MAISLASIQKSVANPHPRVLLYGPPGIGKTSLAAEFPAPVFIQVEDGTPSGLALDSFGRLSSFEQVMEAITSLYREEHGFKTVVLDNLSEFERLVFAETCTRNQWKTIEAPGYGKGYKEADYVWSDFLGGVNALREHRRLNIVLIAHSTIERFDDPATQSYSRYEIDLHDRGRAIIERDMDAILLIKQDVSVDTEDQGFNKKRTIAKAGGTRWIYAEGRPGWTAKNRYGMPDKFPFEKGRGFDSIAAYLPRAKASPNASDLEAAA